MRIVACGPSKHSINQVAHEIVVREYRFDPISTLGKENCTVGALRARATHVDTSVKSTLGLKPR